MFSNFNCLQVLYHHKTVNLLPLGKEKAEIQKTLLDQKNSTYSCCNYSPFLLCFQQKCSAFSRTRQQESEDQHCPFPTIEPTQRQSFCSSSSSQPWHLQLSSKGGMTKLKRKQRRKRFTTVSRALEEVVGLIPEARLLMVKNNRKGRYCLSLPCTWLDLHMTSMTMLNGSFPSPVGYKKNSAFNQHVSWQHSNKVLFFKSKYYLSLNPLCSRIVHVFLKSAGTNTNFNFTALLSLLFFILTSQKLLLLLHKTKKFLVPFFIVFSVIT